MKKKNLKLAKKAIAVILCIITMLSTFSIMCSATDKTANDGLNWVKSQLGKGLDYDGVYGAQCVDLIKYYYAYLGVSAVSGNGCDYAWNSLPSGWSRVQGGKPQPGDILVYSGNSSNPYGHVAIYESDRVHYHQNFNGHSYVEKVTYMYNGLGNPYWGYIRPNWSSGGGTPASYFTSVWVDGISNTNATIYATTNLTYVERTGFYIGTSTSSMTRKIEDTYANVLKAWFTMSDCGITLKPATTYYYKIFIIVNGKEYCTETKSFKTTGTTYTISYHTNGGSGAPSNQTKVTDEKITLSTTKPTRSGYTFKCWNTKSDGTGTNYNPGSTYSANASVTLYAQWTADKKNFKVTYNANGGSSIIQYEYVEEGKSIALTTPFKYFKINYNANGGANAPSAESLSINCLGWSTSSSASTATYKCGASYKPTANVTLYAVWEDTVITDLSSQKPVRNGYTFLGWSEDPNATEAYFSPEEEVEVSGNATLYAVWQKNGESPKPTEPTISGTITINYKDTYDLKANGINCYNVKVDDGKIVSVDSNGVLRGLSRGKTTITVYDSYGSAEKYNVEVKYTWWQWIIKIVLFGWIWY